VLRVLTRRQLRWLALLGTVMVLGLLVGSAVQPPNTWASVAPSSVGAGLPLAAGGQPKSVSASSSLTTTDSLVDQSLRPPVWLDVMTDPASAQPDGQVTVTVRLHADAAISQPRLTALLPRGLSFQANPGDASPYEMELNQVHWPLPDLRAGEDRVVLFHLRMAADAPDFSLLGLQLSAPGYESTANGAVPIRRPFPAIKVRITPEGGELRSSDGRVQIIFPPGAITQTVRVEQQPMSLAALAPQVAGLALQCQLNVVSEDTGIPVRHFALPLELRVDLRDLVDWSSVPFYQHPYLGYREEGGAWQALPTRREGTVLIAALDDAGLIGAGLGSSEGVGWVLPGGGAPNPLFDGAFTYDYPIQVPAGQGGLTPDLNINYNSRRVDGLLTWVQADWLGLGWDIDTMEIVRQIAPGNTWNSGAIDYANNFTLYYQGAAYHLAPAAEGSSGEQPYGRYYADSNLFADIERRNPAGGDATAQQQSKEYWTVRLRDGAEYELGFTDDSTQAISTSRYDNSGPGAWQDDNPPTSATDYAGVWRGHIVYRWRVDQIKDAQGDRIRYHYQKVSVENPWRETASYLDRVEYNFTGDQPGAVVSFGRESRWDQGGDALAPNTQFFYQDDYLKYITVENRIDGQLVPVRKYAFTYTQRSVPASQHDNHTRLLATIEQYRQDGTPLPYVTFGYTAYPNKALCQQVWGGNCTDGKDDAWDQESFRYERLTRIDDGYGGVITATYETPDSGACGTNVPDDGCTAARNYRIKEKVVRDSHGGGYKVDYIYPSSVADRGYDSNSTYGCDWLFGPEDHTYGTLVGYRQVTEVCSTLENVVISTVTHTFQLNSESAPGGLGKEIAVERRDANWDPLWRPLSAWHTAACVLAGLPAGIPGSCPGGSVACRHPS